MNETNPSTQYPPPPSYNSAYVGQTGDRQTPSPMNQTQYGMQGATFGIPPPPPPSVYMGSSGFSVPGAVPPPPMAFPVGYEMNRGFAPPPPVYPPMGTPFVEVPAFQTVTLQQPCRIYTRHPTRVTCPYCNNVVTTMPRSEVGTATWVACTILFCMGCALGCCLIPFCVEDAKNHHHICPHCKKTIDIYRPM